MKVLPSVTPQKIEALASQVKQLCETKSKLERNNKELRDNNNEMFLNLSYFEAQKKFLLDLENT